MARLRGFARLFEQEAGAHEVRRVLARVEPIERYTREQERSVGLFDLLDRHPVGTGHAAPLFVES
jgi:hypothetical protein